MSDLYMIIGGGLSVLVDYDYQSSERGDQETPPVKEGVTINAVMQGTNDIMFLLNGPDLEEIKQNVFDSFDKELQEPDRE
jgi:hypothetical protein